MAQSSIGSNAIIVGYEEAEDEVNSRPPVALISTIGRPKPLLEPAPSSKKPRLTARQFRKEFARRTARMSVKIPTQIFYLCTVCNELHSCSQ